MPGLDKIDQLSAYQIVERKTIKEMSSEGVILEHKKTGAKIFLISNDDDNKVFCIGFRTPPADDTGVPHILEHSVLCGSEKFPLKDPFVELVKGSLNTFLNAMTYPDKTVYPIASCNDTDFQNLMDVYMDAVLHPNIYKEEKIFRQEGWHYEMEDADSELIYNGVVYNEMKGVYSSPESVLERCIQTALFPDTCYGKDSGGDPDFIPSLTYEEFLDFHRTYYHPSNSYIYLYGDMDMAEKLEWLDKEYLSKYEKKEVHSEIALQKPFAEPVKKECFYSITDEEALEHATYLSITDMITTNLDPKLYLAFQILEYALIEAPGAVLKQALIDAGIGTDIFGGYENGVLQTYFSVTAKDADKEQLGEFLAVIKGTLRKLADQGINKKSLLAGINLNEFRYREADFGSAPKGLMFGLQCLDSWLYDGNPMTHLEYDETFQALKAGVEDGYFESLIREYLLDNPFEAIITLSPERNLTAKKDEETAKKLEDYKNSLKHEDWERIAASTKELKEYQDTPSTPEVLAMIPLLKRKDIDTKAETFKGLLKNMNDTPVLYHEYHTSGISYLGFLFDTSAVPQEDLPYVGLLKSVLGSISTREHSYADLTSEIYLNTGGISYSVNSYINLADTETFQGKFYIGVRVLYEKLDFAFDIVREILTESLLDDEKRLGEIISETKSRARMKLESSGNSTAVSRATSYFSAIATFNEATGGTAYFRFLEKLAAEYDTNKKQVIEKLQAVTKRLFVRENLLINYTSDQEGMEPLELSMKRLTDHLPTGDGVRYPFTHEVCNQNEGLKTSGQVNYVARCGNFAKQGLHYTGALKILQVILSYDYLWLNVRVKGGAYGCMSGFGRSGESYLVSYRDPNLKETNEVYEGVVNYLEEFDVDERDMTKYVIGTISNLDTPLTPSTKGARELSAYLSGVTDEMMQQERDEVLAATSADIRALAPYLRAVLDTGSFCVVGNGDKIEANRTMFENIDALAH